MNILLFLVGVILGIILVAVIMSICKWYVNRSPNLVKAIGIAFGLEKLKNK